MGIWLASSSGMGLRWLIASVGQMAEGGGLAVKGDAQGLGLLLVQQLVQNIQKAKHGVGGLARPVVRFELTP